MTEAVKTNYYLDSIIGEKLNENSIIEKVYKSQLTHSFG